jgi:hypothetical protein
MVKAESAKAEKKYGLSALTFRHYIWKEHWNKITYLMNATQAIHQ